MSEEYHDSLVNIDEACNALGISRSTVFRLIRRGAIPSVRRGGRRLIRKQALVTAGLSRMEHDIAPLTPDHPIFRLVGAGHGGGRPPGARHKHAIID